MKNRVDIINFNYRAVSYIALFIILLNTIFPNILSNVKESCLWVNRETLRDSTSIDSVIYFSEKNNINKVFFQVRSRGDALYESQLVPKYEQLEDSFDPLKYIIDKTRNTNIEVHAWFNTYLLWSSNNPPSDSTHIYYKCPNCLAADINGKSDKDIKLNQNQSLNWEGVFLSPIHPNVNAYLLLVLDELLKTYNIDGIHFDYIRYQDLFYGYNNEGIKNFEKTHNFNPKDLNRGIISTRFGYTSDEVDSLSNIWDNYRMNSITNFLRSVRNLINLDGIDIDLSVAVKPNIINSKYRWYQDWLLWIQEDIIDYAVVMNYENDINKFNLNNKLIKDRLINKQIGKIIMGVSLYNNNSKEVTDKILLSRLGGFENFSLYNYNINKNNLNFYTPIYHLLNFNLEE